MPSEPEARRAAALRSVASALRASLVDVDALIAQAPEALRRIQRDRADLLVIMAGGALLHAFYNELEKIFEHIAVELDGFEPKGDDWHARLAERMFIEVNTLRPAILPAELRGSVRDYRAFRHLFRHLYALDLDPDRVIGLLVELARFWAEARAGLLQFAATLEQIAGDLEDTNNAQ